MLDLLAQIPPSTFWSQPNGSVGLILAILAAVVIGGAILFGFLQAPTRARRWIVFGFTFLSGLFYVLYWLVPAPIKRAPGDAPRDAVEAAGFWFNDALPRIADVAQILTGFLLGLGIYSLVKVHLEKVVKKQKDHWFSALLLGSMVVMIVFGYADFYLHSNMKGLDDIANWTPVNYTYDLLFDGFYQNMESAMFSMIAFYILSASYRAFRIRSVESTVMMGSALILMLSLMGAVVVGWGHGVDALVRATHLEVLNNLRIDEVAKWVKNDMQTPSLRAINFGVGLGAMAMGLRIWLGLERGGVL